MGAAQAVRPPRVRCRPIAGSDREGLLALLKRGFPDRSGGYWDRAVENLERHTAAQGFPHHGFVLEADGRIVGILLMIFNRIEAEGGSRVRCNLSSWCVDDAVRSYGPLLVNAATRDKTVTYVNISPEASTRTTVEAQGFSKYCDGIVFALPLLSGLPPLATRCRDGDGEPPAGATPADIALMGGHAGFDCIKLWCETSEGAYPFIFAKGRRLRGLLRSAHVVYCSGPDLLARFARPLGGALLRHGIGLMTVDADAPVPGLTGWYRSGATPKYFKGPLRPRLGDLSFTELPMFGV